MRSLEMQRRRPVEVQRMAYDHSRKAGNRGDVWKHAVLVALTDGIKTDSDSFRYVESHAGAPLHELKDNGEWRHGVDRIAGNASHDSRYPAIAGEWLRTRRYPAGWVFAADRLARRFEHVEVKLFDTSPDVAERYRQPSDLPVPSNVGVKFEQQDGYSAALEAADADFVFLDPPYNSSKDWRRVGEVCRTLAERKLKFAGWYPFCWPTRPKKLSDSTRCAGWEVAWAACGPKPSQNLKGCGVLMSDDLSAFLPKKIEDDLRKFAACIGWEFSIRRPAG